MKNVLMCWGVDVSVCQQSSCELSIETYCAPISIKDSLPEQADTEVAQII